MNAVKRPDYFAFTFSEGCAELVQLGVSFNDLAKLFLVQSCKIL